MDSEVRRLALGCLLSSFPGDAVPSWVWRAVDDGLGGVCLYGSNRGADVRAVAAALHEVRAGVVVALDEEGGDVTRLEAATGSSVPGNAALGAVDDVALTGAVAAALGSVLRSSGVDLDLAPCADVNSDPDNPVIGVRSFGADAALVARHTAAFVAGLRSAGVAACAKHFPGHGAVAVDSHLALPTVAAASDVLWDRELAPFRAAVDAGVAAVMPGHLRVPALDPDAPASVSPAILTGMLRGEMGFDGLVVTDALDMGGIGGPAEIPANVVLAIAAGADLCCLGPDNDDALVVACADAVVAAVASGALPAERVADAASRVAGLRARVEAASSDLTSVSSVGAAERRQNEDGHGDPVVLASVSSVGAAERRQNEDAPPAPDAALGTLRAVGTEAAHRALRVDGTLRSPLRGAHVVELDRPANIAAGAVPWGVAASLAALDPTASATRVAEGDDTALAHALTAAAGRPVVVVVRDPQRRPAQAAAARIVLTARPDAVVVDMGWPSVPPAEGSGAARITTFGASRASGEAVARLLAEGHASPGTRPPSSAASPERAAATSTEGRIPRG
jgi:beta-N-acetylhexosaminidase